MSQKLTLEEFIAFNDELEAMTQAHIPLSLGLKNLGPNQSRGLKNISETIRRHVESGKSLEEAIRIEKESFPPMYSHLVVAGVKAGNLNSALESVSAFSWDFLKVRKSLNQALIYPIIVILIMYTFFILFMAFVVSIFQSTYFALGVESGIFLQTLSSMSENILAWCWIPPLLFVLLFILLFRKKITGFGMGTVSLIFSIIPGMKKILNDYSYSTFTDILSILVRHKTPLAEAIRLSADATGNRQIQQSAINLSAELEMGKALKNSSAKSYLPQHIWYLITQGYEETSFADSLKRASEMYRNRAITRADRLRNTFPTIATVAVGGTAVLLYALCLFLPLIDLYSKVSLIG